jgi:hypothetical protein
MLHVVSGDGVVLGLWWFLLGLWWLTVDSQWWWWWWRWVRRIWVMAVGVIQVIVVGK